MAYHSSYTGPQIDQAVGNALNKDTSTLSNDVNHIPASSVVKSALSEIVWSSNSASQTYSIPCVDYNGVLNCMIITRYGIWHICGNTTDIKIVSISTAPDASRSITSVNYNGTTKILGVTFNNTVYGGITAIRTTTDTN